MLRVCVYVSWMELTRIAFFAPRTHVHSYTDPFPILQTHLLGLLRVRGVQAGKPPQRAALGPAAPRVDVNPPTALPARNYGSHHARPVLGGGRRFAESAAVGPIESARLRLWLHARHGPHTCVSLSRQWGGCCCASISLSMYAHMTAQQPACLTLDRCAHTTGLNRWAPWALRALSLPFSWALLQTPREGARPIVFLATSKRCVAAD